VLDLGGGQVADRDHNRCGTVYIKLVVGGRHTHVGLEHRGCVPDCRGELRSDGAREPMTTVLRCYNYKKIEVVHIYGKKILIYKKKIPGVLCTLKVALGPAPGASYGHGQPCEAC
jgi:hypothetical protein